jgi:hypothetical protein
MMLTGINGVRNSGHDAGRDKWSEEYWTRC